MYPAGSNSATWSVNKGTCYGLDFSGTSTTLLAACNLGALREGLEFAAASGSPTTVHSDS